MKFTIDEKIIIFIGFGVLGLIIFGSIYDKLTFKPFVPKPQIEVVIESPIDTQTYEEYYEPPNTKDIIQEHLAYGKKLYADGDYFGAREEFYVVRTYGGGFEAEYWIGVCDAQLEDLCEEQKLKEEQSQIITEE